MKAESHLEAVVLGLLGLALILAVVLSHKPDPQPLPKGTFFYKVVPESGPEVSRE